jgi:hypothetical protein
MMKRTILGISMAAALTLSACGGGDSSSDTTAPAEDTTPAAGAIDLSGVCPAKVILQTDWNPESEHGMLYQLIGPGYEVDTEKVAVRGDLVANGQPTGVQVEVRPGGPAVGYQQVTALLYQDPEIMLGFTSTDEAVSNSVEKPTKAVFAPFNINPQIIMWDPATYPEAKTIADLKEPGVKVRYFDGAAYMDYFTANGILDKKQVDGTYDGTPASFIAAGGKDAQQGFGTAEPYFYEKVLKDWMKPVAYQYIHDAGWTAYASSLGGTPESLSKNAECLKKLVPVMQQALLDYVKSPDTTNAMILDAVNQFNNGWVYDAGQAAASVEKQLADKLVANSPDGTLGSFDLQRVTDFIALATPVYETTGAKVKDGLTAEDIVTNEFIDPSIKLG